MGPGQKKGMRDALAEPLLKRAIGVIYRPETELLSHYFRAELSRQVEPETYRVIHGEGVPCPRCGRSTQIREHAAITEWHLSQPYYFQRWFYCRNPNCSVTVHVLDEFKMRKSGIEEIGHDSSSRAVTNFQICLDERAQPRSSIDKRIVTEYAQEMDHGAVFPPVTYSTMEKICGLLTAFTVITPTNESRLTSLWQRCIKVP
jgi:hypothetical protein